MHNKDYEVEDHLRESISGQCPIIELKEEVEAEERYKEEPCGKKVAESGLCE